jgi:hypothetical protein
MNTLETALLLAAIGSFACANSATPAPATTPPPPPSVERAPATLPPSPVVRNVAPRDPDPPPGSRSDWRQPPKTEADELAREEACAEDPQTDVNRCPFYRRSRLSRARSAEAAREKAQYDQEQSAKQAAERKCQQTPDCIAPRIIAAICENETRLRTIQAELAAEQANADGGADSKQLENDREEIRATLEAIRQMKQELQEQGHRKFVESMCKASSR